MKSVFTKIAMFSLAGFLVMGCGKPKVDQNKPADTATTTAAEEKATLDYFTAFFTKTTAAGEGLLSTKTAVPGSKIAKSYGKNVPFEAELRLNENRSFVFRLLPAMPKAEDHPCEHCGGHGGPENSGGQWKVEGKQVTLIGLGKLEQAKQGDKNAAKLTFSQKVGHYDLTSVTVLMTYEIQPKVQLSPLGPNAPRMPHSDMSSEQIRQLKQMVVNAGVAMVEAKRAVDSWLEEKVRYTYDVTTKTINDLVERARRLKAEEEDAD